MDDNAKKKKEAKQSMPLQKILNGFDFFDFPPITKEILDSKVDQSGEDKIIDNDVVLDEDEIRKASTEMLPFIKELFVKVEEEAKNCGMDCIISFESTVKFTHLMLNCLPEGKNVPESLMQIVHFFNQLLNSNFDNKARKLMSAVCETCCLNQKNLRLSGHFVTNTLVYLFDVTLDKNDKPANKDIKRVWNMRDVIYQMSMEGNAFDQLKGKFLQTVVSPVYLTFKEGQQFIAFLLNYNPKFIKRIHEDIKFFLPDANKVQAAAYGKIYHTAWTNADEECRQIIEKQCFQDLMSRLFELKRSPGYMEMSRLGKNVLAILSYLHENRKQIHLSKVITELYTPLIWRHLRSGNNIIRCNAAEVFLDVYPLEKPGVGRADQATLLQRQHDEMTDLLTDNCHIVRIIAVKGICNCFKNYWETFSPENIQILIKIMIKDMIYDCAAVRKAVYQGFTKMLKNPVSAKYLAKVLPSLKNHIHDENEAVRVAFVEMLIQLKELPDSFPLKYWKVVPAEHLAARLALENEEVGRPLAKLMMEEFYSPEKPMSAILKRIFKLTLMNHNAAKTLFAYSRKILPLNAAVEIMLNILVVINKRLKELDLCNGKNVQQSSPHSKKKRHKSNRVLKEHCDNNADDSNGSLDSSAGSSASNSSNESNASVKENIPQPECHQLDNPDVCRCFIEIVTILWTINSTKLLDPANKELNNKLQSHCAACVPLFLRHFKGTDVFFAVIHLASLIPLAMLAPQSTISSMCVSHLKELTHSSKKEETEVYVNALCAWNRGAEILELATDWLDQAFRSEHLNQSAVRSSLRQRKVKFQNCEAKPMLALNLLDIVFSHETNRIHMLKNYNAVYELFTFLERIKILIERRVEMDTPFPASELSDDFLHLTLYRYAKLILILHKPISDDSDASSDVSSIIGSFVSAPKVFSELLEWANRVLVPKIPEDLNESESSITVTILQNIAKAGCLMISANFTSSSTTDIFITFIHSLLESGCKLAYVDVAIRALKEITENTETHYENDENKVLRVALPSLLINIVDVLCAREIKKSVLSTYISDCKEMQRCITTLPQALIRSFTAKSPTLMRLLKIYTRSCLGIIADDIIEVDMFDPTDKVQNLPNCCSILVSILLSKANICKLWISYLPDIISSIGTDSVQILAAISLLHTLSFTNKSYVKEELKKSVTKAYEIVTALPDDTDSSVSLNPKTLGIPELTEIASKIGCVLT